MEILHIENLNFRYPKAEKDTLHNISLNIGQGDFTVICGATGCGKTTLLKLIKNELAPAGEKSGEILYNGKSIDSLSLRESACAIGFVGQNPDNQIVTDKVWHELSFGLENLGVPQNVIRRRVGEMASYFGIQDWFRKKTDELSGGQKQLLNLASVMVMQPKVLILDEPTSQLDPIAAADFIATLKKLNTEFGITVLLVEHRLEDVFPIADKVLLMENGCVLLYDSPRAVGKNLKKINPEHPMLKGLPSAVRLYNLLSSDEVCPLTVKEGQEFFRRNFKRNIDFSDGDKSEYSDKTDTAIELKNVWFRYERDLPDILRGVNLKADRGETICILGGNGTGKTTMLNVISGLNKPYRGKIKIDGKKIKDYKGNSLYRKKLAYLPQNPQTVFLKDTVSGDLEEMLKAMEYKKEEREEKIRDISEKLGITDLLTKHPYDLSGGEQQKCALAKMLFSEPTILLLDEPTKGLDAFSKSSLLNVLKKLKSDGITVVMVTHDVEFAAVGADRCALFFDGEIVSSDAPNSFFAENNFYTTAANRIARPLCPTAITSEEAAECCRGNGEDNG